MLADYRAWLLIVTALLSMRPSEALPERNTRDIAQAAGVSMQSESTDREHAHPVARDLMKEDWLWSVTDEDSPFGNDDGADAVALYRDWREAHKKESIMTGVRNVCSRLEMPFDEWCQVSEAAIHGDAGSHNFFTVAPGDLMLIAIAFGQLADEGYVDPELRKWGLHAIENEQIPTMCDRWIDKGERKNRLEVMKSILMKAPAKPEAK